VSGPPTFETILCLQPTRPPMHDPLYDSLFAALEHGATVITVNHRLARALRSRFNAHQIARGAAAWRTPSIASFDAWCDARWDELVDGGRHSGRHLPSEAQEAALWERIVDESPEGDGLIQTGRTARQALEAWRLAAEWQLPIHAVSDAELNDDCRAFLGWARRYGRELAERAWVDRARLVERIAEAFGDGVIVAPTEIWLAGFDEPTPLQNHLFDAMRGHGARVHLFTPPVHDATVATVALDDAHEELRCAARWARALLDRGETGLIGIVVPQLQSMRARVDAVFSDHLLPSSVLPDAAERVRPFNISSGRPLADYPIVASALLALELCDGRMAVERAGALIRSPFVGGAATELSSRALLDARLRRRGRMAVSLRELRTTAATPPKEEGGDPPTYAAPTLAERLEDWELEAGALALDRAHRPSEWAQIFAKLLATLGWPGDREPTSAEHQALEKWWELLATYATLDGVIAPERCLGAVRRLARMASGIDFQPRTDEAPVQILGTLEAAGMRFDHLWVAGMHDEEMPATPKPNPFLPVRLQRTHNVARASAERELEFARTVVDGLLASAPHVIVSYPKSDGERPLEASPLLAHLPLTPASELASSDIELFSAIVHGSGARESLVDETAPPIAPGVPVAGGTGILRDQAACPFRAFATHRLGAKPLEKPAPGLDAMERGRLMHAVLETFWADVKTHAALVRLDEDALERKVTLHVTMAVDAAAKDHPETFSPRFAGIEKKRLAKIVREWMKLERERLPFTVRHIEAEERITLGGVEMRVRIDRVDELSDGRKVFIDYKTSRPSSRKWFGERPDEPQLPIYCTTCDDVAAVLFVQLKPDEVKFNGIAAEKGIVPGVKEFAGEDDVMFWEQINPRWKQVLESIGREFMNGRAEVAPKDPRDTCLYCEVGPLCRVRDLSATEVEL
jgi:ATP-dependent helicase/nuclease subunit B